MFSVRNPLKKYDGSGNDYSLYEGLCEGSSEDNSFNEGSVKGDPLMNECYCEGNSLYWGSIMYNLLMKTSARRILFLYEGESLAASYYK